MFIQHFFASANRPTYRALLFVLFSVLLSNGSALSVFAQNDPLLRINAGSEDEATGAGVTFTGDTFFSESSVGPVLTVPIDGTVNDGIYQSERIAKETLEPFGYAIPIDNGSYSLALHFAETAFQSDGQRVFNVNVEGIPVLTNYDIHAQAGGANKAVVENVLNVNVNDGVLNIDFNSVLQRAKISAFEIFGNAGSVSIPFGINAGGPAYSSASYSWMEDDGTYFLEGTPFSKVANIAGTDDDDLYEAERFANNLRFILPGLEQALYTVELHFAETFHMSSGLRLFDISIEGQTVNSNYDIFAEAGGFSTAVVETYENVLVSDGILNITLTRSVGSATINAISITEVSSVANEDEGAIERPESYLVSPAYPNPFNPQTRFNVSVGATQRVDVEVYNLLGQRVASLFSGTMPARQNRAFEFEAGGLPSGIYLIQVRGEHFTDTQRVALMK